MFRVTEALGLGMGGMDGTCGAVSGACVLAGLKNSSAKLDAPDSKAASYQLSRKIMSRFKEENQSTRCADLKGAMTGVVLRKCPDCIRDAARIAEEILFE